MITSAVIGDRGGDSQGVGDRGELGGQRGLTIDVEGIFSGPDHVQLEHGDRAGEWILGILDVVAGAVQTDFFGIPGRKQHRAARYISLRLPTAGNFQ